MKTTRFLRKKIETPPASGAPFEISEQYERSEALRRGDGLTWWDDLRFTIYVPLLLLAIIVLASLAVYSLWGLLH